MLETLVVTFREGLEAFLIVAITLAYIQKIGADHLRRAVFMAIATALIVSATTGWHIAEAADSALMEGSLSLIAGILVASLTYVIMQGSAKIAGDIRAKIDLNNAKNKLAGSIGLFIFVTLMITREGMETALMLSAIAQQQDAVNLLIGALLGLSLTAIIGYLWVKQSQSLNLKLFMQVTGVFLILFAVHLVLYGIYELTEVEGLMIYNPALHQILKPYVSSKTLFGQLTIYGLLIVPSLWLIIGYFRQKQRHSK